MALPVVVQIRSYSQRNAPPSPLGDCELPTLGTRRLSELFDKPSGRVISKDREKTVAESEKRRNLTDWRPLV